MECVAAHPRLDHDHLSSSLIVSVTWRILLCFVVAIVENLRNYTRQKR
jgi:hypothetical protein